jgi:hypothetical protein
VSVSSEGTKTVAHVPTPDVPRQAGINQLTYENYVDTAARSYAKKMKYLLLALAGNVRSFHGCQSVV